MSTFLWWVIAKRETPKTLVRPHRFFSAHAVREQGHQQRTVCGLPVPQLSPDTEWRMRDELGDWRPCSRCDHIIAIHADRGDQPAT